MWFALLRYRHTQSHNQIQQIENARTSNHIQMSIEMFEKMKTSVPTNI